MKIIIFTKPNGEIGIVHPREGFRLASKVTLDGVEYPINPPASVDSIFRRWPVEGAVAEWAETEEEFLARVQSKSVPVDALNPVAIDGSVLPADRSKRKAWRQQGNTVVVDAAIESQMDGEAARVSEIESNISTDTFGTPAKTLKQLSEMSWSDFNTWWGANVTTTAAAIVVLKRLTYFVLRRCKA
jgi:hypothetical protein